MQHWTIGQQYECLMLFYSATPHWSSPTHPPAHSISTPSEWYHPPQIPAAHRSSRPPQWSYGSGSAACWKYFNLGSASFTPAKLKSTGTDPCTWSPSRLSPWPTGSPSTCSRPIPSPSHVPATVLNSALIWSCWPSPAWTRSLISSHF